MDYDWLIIGSGFGGSVSALRLAEKGYSVAVLEAGRRYADDDLTWNITANTFQGYLHFERCGGRWR